MYLTARRQRIIGAFLCGLLGACSALPPAPEQTHSKALPESPSGLLAQAADRATEDLPPGSSAAAMILAADDAMRRRLLLIDNAVSAIDAQYFIWKDDAAGSLLLERLLAAADRGVRVRLLVDDMFLSTGGAFSGSDDAIAALSQHPNLEIKLFNPGKYRSGIIGLAGNFGGSLKSYNRRMHNKLMIADGRFAILGGRNIGDEYFGLHRPYNFLDLDVLVAGAELPYISAAFDNYWNADLAFPGSALQTSAPEDLAAVRQETSDYVQEQRTLLAPYLESTPQDAEAALLLGMHAGSAIFLQDEPRLRGGEELRLYDMLDRAASPGDHELLISTPYLIPVGNFLGELEQDVEAGVDVRVLTNSLASNDATAAHAHYKKYRKSMLDTGARLFEFKDHPSPAILGLADVAGQEGNFVGLHAKAASSDSQTCFIGSLNIDPRSVELNTENGLLLESEGLCSEMREFLATLMDGGNAWEVSLATDDRLQWRGEGATLTSQPARDWTQRMSDFFFRLLPLEGQL